MLVLKVGLVLISIHGTRGVGDTAGYVTTLGRDTIAIERYSRTSSRLSGEIVLRVPGTVYFSYAVDLARDGSVIRSTLEQKPMAAPGVTRRRATLEFSTDSVRVTIDSGGTTRQSTVAVRAGTVPFLITGFDSSFGIYESFGYYDLLLSQVGAQLADSVSVPAIDAMTGRVRAKRLARRSGDRIDSDFFGIAWTHFTVDTAGTITAADAGATTEKTRAVRVAPPDVVRAAKEFAARDRNGRGVGIASPPDSVRAVIGALHLAIDYSSPRRRARTILGGVVPYGQIWRTGANSATTMFIDRPLTIDGTLIPAGGYSLWTRPTPSGVDLVINRQTGQWGTDYDPARDLVRIPMQVSLEEKPRENFSITVRAAGDSGELLMQWDTFVWKVLLKPS